MTVIASDDIIIKHKDIRKELRMSVNIAKIAEMCGVSTATVSFVINDKPGVSPATAKRVWDTIKKTGYKPRGANGSGIAGLRANCIGVLMAEGVMSSTPLYARFFEAVNRELGSRDLKMTPIIKSVDSDFSPHSFSDIDGLILCSYYEELAEKMSIPFVSVFRHPAPQGPLYGDHIEPANDRIGVMAASYFVRRGHKKLYVVNPAIGPHPAFESRVRHFVEQSEREGVHVELVHVPYQDTDEQGNLIDGLEVPAIQDFISNFQSQSDAPTGIYIPCDAYLTILQKAFDAKGIRPGVDVEFLGTNNDYSFFQGLTVRPATIDIHPEALARAAIVALLQRIAEIGLGEQVAVFKVVNVDGTLVEAGPGIKGKWDK